MNFIYSKLYMSITVLVTIVMSQFFLIAEEQTLIDKSTDGDELTLEPTKNKKDMTGVYNKDVYLRCQITDPVNVRTLTVSPITDADEAVDMKTVKGHASVYELLGNKDGSLTIQGVQSVKQFGTFGMVITGTVKKEAKGKGESTQESSWDFSGTGIGLVKKCTNAFSKNTTYVAWDPEDKNLQGWNMSENIEYIGFSCPIDSNITWTKVENYLPGGDYGYFERKFPEFFPPVSLKKKTQCPQCSTNCFLYEEYLLDWEFFDTKMVAHTWNESDSAGPLTQARWYACLQYCVMHENTHRNDFKSNILDVVKPQKFTINICSHNNSTEYAKKDDYIVEENQNMIKTATNILKSAIQNYRNVSAALDAKATNECPYMSGNLSVKD